MSVRKSVGNKNKQRLGELQTQFIDALRGKGKKKYKRGKRQLLNKDGNTSYYCCLGVACDLFKDRLKGQWVYDNDEGKMAFKIGKKMDVYGLLPSVQRLLKFRGALGDHKSEENSPLSVINDSSDSDGFEHIVRKILKDPSCYFTEPT